MSDEEFLHTVLTIAEEMQTLRRHLFEASGDLSEEPSEEAILNICRRVSSSLTYELIEREPFAGTIVKVTDHLSGRFCMIPPDDGPTRIEGPGTKHYKFTVEVRLLQRVEVEAEDELAAQELAFAQVESMPVGECEDITVSFHDGMEDFGATFSLN